MIVAANMVSVLQRCCSVWYRVHSLPLVNPRCGLVNVWIGDLLIQFRKPCSTDLSIIHSDAHHFLIITPIKRHHFHSSEFHKGFFVTLTMSREGFRWWPPPPIPNPWPNGWTPG